MNLNPNASQAQTQAEAILRRLLTGEHITPLEALDGVGSFRLSARIYDLKRRGWPIRSRLVDVGDGRRVAEYSLDLDASWTQTPDEENQPLQGRQGSLDLGGGC
ncbi:hypothetical protein Apau_1668 [Aminomonas paucivorans DSM 12260]|uniref:Winged helix-turn-helix domain-containing protein n=1 Tax=Aminomonas paucivorans DSM 12260 TaxID=584708 RepID=E3CUW1_9BACT|nr:helix-turn-helix domain-containing protein [Aminomonas paucivorans]EFQ24087.1 hypothetical protein Apau_1668 [Aminomonas paucivorans DSM 12260]